MNKTKSYDLYREFNYKKSRYYVVSSDITIDDYDVSFCKFPYPFLDEDGNPSKDRRIWNISIESHRANIKNSSYLGTIDEFLFQELLQCDYQVQIEKILDREGITKKQISGKISGVKSRTVDIIEFHELEKFIHTHTERPWSVWQNSYSQGCSETFLEFEVFSADARDFEIYEKWLDSDIPGCPGRLSQKGYGEDIDITTDIILNALCKRGLLPEGVYHLVRD